MDQENQQGTKRTYAQAIRKKTKPPQETRPQETTEPTQETRHATPPEQSPNDDEPFLIRTRDALWTTTEDLHQSRLLKSSSAVLHFLGKRTTTCRRQVGWAASAAKNRYRFSAFWLRLVFRHPSWFFCQKISLYSLHFPTQRKRFVFVCFFVIFVAHAP